MKKLSLMLMCIASAMALGAQTNANKYYVYGVDFSQAKVYAADESVEQFAKAFEGINLLLIQEPDKYDFSYIVNARVEVVIEPMMNKLSACEYANLRTFSQSYDEPDCAAIVSEYTLPQTEGLGVVLIAKFLNKTTCKAAYDLVIFDIASREIRSITEVTGSASGFGLRNFWANSVYRALKFNNK